MTFPDVMLPNQIIPLILYEVKDYLADKLIVEVPDDSPTKAVILKVGRYQENPADKNVSIAISGGDYDDPDFIDARVTHPDLNDIRIRNLPEGEIGGGTYWWRRFSVYVSVFFIKQNYEEDRALQYAYEFYGRLQSAIEQVRMNLVDDFGERASGSPYFESATYYQSGGKNKWIFRGKLRFRVLTHRQ